MVARTHSGRYGPPEQREGYSVGRWLDYVLQHRITEHRSLLASRDAAHADGARSESCRDGDDWVCGEPVGEEGDER